MGNLQEIVQNEFEQWVKQPPNVVNRGLGTITEPISIVLSPVVDKMAPLLEGVVMGVNNVISAAIEEASEKIPDFENLDEKSFNEWFLKADHSAKNLKSLGIGALTVEGGATGIGGFTSLLIDIPASFTLILGFANKIALAYGLPIRMEEVQIKILQAITLGSSNNIKEKIGMSISLKSADKTLQMSWKKMYQQSLDNILSMEKVMVFIREFLKKIGINITRRKAGQIIPLIGGGAGAVINGAWASDALEAVRQYSRNWIIQKYYEKPVEN